MPSPKQKKGQKKNKPEEHKKKKGLFGKPQSFWFFDALKVAKQANLHICPVD